MTPTWVLRRRLGLARTEVAAFFEGLLGAADLEREDEPVVQVALRGFRQGPGDFADHLIGAANAAGGCRTTYIFDRAAAKAGYFTPFPAAGD